MLSRSYKGFDVAILAWSAVLLTLFAILNLAAAAQTQAMKVIDRNLDQQYPTSELDLLPFNTNDTSLQISNTYWPAVATDRTSRAILLVDEDRRRRLEVAPDTLRRVQQMLRNSTELTFLTKIKQNPDNTGTLIALHVDTTRVLELASHGRTDEILIYFRNATGTFTLGRINYHLADNKWHNLAVTLHSLSGLVTFRLDCTVVHQAPLTPDMLDILRWRDLSLWLGQRNSNSVHNRELLKGALRDVKVVTGPNAYLSQCLDIVQVKPVAMELAVMNDNALLRKLQDQIDTLTNTIQIISTEHKNLAERVTFLEQRPSGSCLGHNGSWHQANEVWEEDCLQCACRNGFTECRDVTCNSTCPSGSHVPPGSCCPVCKPSCTFMGVRYGQEEDLFVGVAGECLRCSCINNSNECVRRVQVTCPVLSCPESQQVEVPGSCCPKCQTKDRQCGKEICDIGASCVDSGSSHNCICNMGFIGNGTHCQDVDECKAAGGNVCSANTICVNTPGSYRCDCLAGYNHTSRNPRACRDINECQSKSDRCHANAKCSNTEGSYNCQCLPGYDGDGFNCTPRCEPECQNGGQCFAPNTCACKGGYFGPECNVDVDECAFNISRCQVHSMCVNIPGSFFCKCLDGFTPVNASSQQPTCQDIDECATGEHKCPPLSRCQNSINGSYQCVCLVGKENCDLSCREEKSIYSKKDPANHCETCQCKAGVWKCEPLTCDCQHQTDPNKMEKCCPQCSTKSAPFCIDPENHQRYPSGFSWFEDCHNCECVYGEIQCLPISCPPVRCNNSILHPDNCCAVCPVSEDQQTVDEKGEDCFNWTKRKGMAPIKFGCETQQPGIGTFFKDWSTLMDLCELCECLDNGICCVVQNDCPVTMTHPSPALHRPVTSGRWRS